jgi:diguanylate cyclase (GGDEF)-like protein
MLEDLASANGTFVGGVAVTSAMLASGARIQFGPNTVLRFAVTDELERAMLQRLVQSSTRDVLTSAYNRAFLFQRLEGEIAYARRHGTQLALLLFDLDHFKRINDSFGHTGGDDVLRAVALKVSALLRAEDLLARYGGEEFAILARAADHLDAVRLGERVRTAVAAEPLLASGNPVTLTISVGVARLAELAPPTTPEQLLKLADERLYRAKGAGRNKVCSGESG